MIDAPDDLENGMFRRKISEDGKHEIGIHPVLFGFRVRAGHTEDIWCEIDYCCQRDYHLLMLVYFSVWIIMKDRIAKDLPVFEEFPVPENKLYNDMTAIAKLLQMMANCHPDKESFELPQSELNEIRKKYFDHLGFPVQ